MATAAERQKAYRQRLKTKGLAQAKPNRLADVEAALSTALERITALECALDAALARIIALEPQPIPATPLAPEPSAASQPIADTTLPAVANPPDVDAERLKQQDREKWGYGRANRHYDEIRELVFEHSQNIDSVAELFRTTPEHVRRVCKLKPAAAPSAPGVTRTKPPAYYDSDEYRKRMALSHGQVSIIAPAVQAGLLTAGQASGSEHPPTLSKRKLKA
jgi:hypothetical protein